MFDKSAAIYKTMLSLEILPYELCIISSHCGEVDGLDQTYEFKTKDNKNHTIRLWAVHAYAPHYDSNEMVTVQFLYVPKEVDGVDWNDKDKIKRIGGGNILKEFTEIDLLQTKVFNNGKIKKVPFSQALSLSDGFYMPRFHGFNSILPPMFINNSCFSSYEMATNFMFAGARGYIGTANSVQTWIAEDFIIKFFDLSDSLPICTRIWLAQKQLYNEKNIYQYVYYGLPFTLMQFSEFKRLQLAKSFLYELYRMLKDYKAMLNIEKYKEIKDRTIDVVRFIEAEIKTFKKNFSI